MSPSETLSMASSALKAAAKRWTDATEPQDRLRTFQALQAASINYATAHDNFNAWLRALPPPRVPQNPGD